MSELGGNLEDRFSCDAAQIIVSIFSEETKKLLTIIIPSVCGVALLGSLLALFGYYWQRRAKAKENTAKLTARMTGNLEEEVVNSLSASVVC